MAWEFPAVSQTRIEFWKQPQYTRKGMLVFTILFGFFGLHHFLLRSPQTGLLFFIANLFTLGYCYWYDIIQLASTPVKDLNEYGMSLPWSAAGIAKGMWKCGDYKKDGNDKEPPNPWWFLAYSLLLPIQPLAKLFTGDSANAFISFLNLTIMPLGFIMLAIEAVYEYFNLFARPANVFANGIDRPFPYTLFGWNKQGKNPKITIEQPAPEPSACPDDDLPFYTRWYKITMEVFGPILQAILPPQVAIAIGAVSNVATQGAKTAESLLQTAEVASQQAQVALESSGKVIQKVGNVVEKIPNLATGPLAQATSLAQNPDSLLTKQVGKLGTDYMKGGGLNVKALQKIHESDTSILDYAVFGLIAAVIGGGFLLHTGRSLADVIHQSTGPSDEPQHS